MLSSYHDVYLHWKLYLITGLWIHVDWYCLRYRKAIIASFLTERRYHSLCTYIENIKHHFGRSQFIPNWSPFNVQLWTKYRHTDTLFSNKLDSNRSLLKGSERSRVTIVFYQKSRYKRGLMTKKRLVKKGRLLVILWILMKNEIWFTKSPTI